MATATAAHRRRTSPPQQVRVAVLMLAIAAISSPTLRLAQAGEAAQPLPRHCDGAVAAGVEAVGLRVRLGASIGLCVTGLQPNAGYEVRLSYPASHPAAFALKLENPPLSALAGGGGGGAAGGIGMARTPAMRRLLNTEKLLFHTDASGWPLPIASVDVGGTGSDVAPGSDGGGPILRVTARHEGVSHVYGSEDRRPLGHGGSAPPVPTVPFNIVVDPLVGGVLPWTAMRMVMLAPFVAVLLFKVVVPMMLYSERSPLRPLFVAGASSGKHR